MSLNDVCCFVPVWFGVSGTIFLAFLTSEVRLEQFSAIQNGVEQLSGRPELL
jgi:hypothetical protein